MGFYGNILNTTRTQFFFDKIYSNKYEMNQRMESDGVHAGRYVLIEYDKNMSADAFISSLYYFNGNMYVSAPLITSSNGDVFPLQPDEKDKVTFGTTIQNTSISDNIIIRLVENHKMSNLNEEAFYIQITGYDYESSNYNYQLVSKQQYIEWVGSHFAEEERYNIAEDFTFYDFEPNLYYVLNDKKEFVLAEEYDKNKDYYIYGFGAKCYLINNLNGIVLNFYSQEDGPQMGDMIIVRKNCSYILNDTEELWKSQVDTLNDNYLYWEKIIDNDKNNYYLNFNIDHEMFPEAKRGYDSTVWQKIYSDGKQSYLMIAELNTILPNFDISADPPSIIPVMPHFDTDSTNSYYNIHMQPQWGFRIKAANNLHLGEEINHYGIPSKQSRIQLTSDEINYPSDIGTEWKTSLYDRRNNRTLDKYYNPKTGLLEDYNEENNYKMPSAIYFNKAGFNPKQIHYSQDLLSTSSAFYDKDIAESGWENDNIIKLQPTGYSGNLYSVHGDNTGEHPQIDTQELSIMIPALGDSIAQMWDIIYGGRDTSDEIASTDNRNLDINWEDASNGIIRKGLRLISDEPGNNGFIKTYDLSKEVNTLAGCINSVHDLMGMILVYTTEEDLQNLQIELQDDDTFVDYKNINADKIYYFANDGTYRRKHQNYSFTEINYIYEKVNDLNNSNYIKNFYYYLDDTNYIPTYEDDYDPNREYYIKKMDVGVSATDNSAFSEVVGLKDFGANGEHFPYQRTLNKDYIYDESFYATDGIIYYQVMNSLDKKIELAGDFKKYSYYYCNDDDGYFDPAADTILNKKHLIWKLDVNNQASSNPKDHYFQLNAIKFNKNIQFPEDYVDNVGKYFYCPGYFYTVEYVLISETPSINNLSNYYKKVFPDIIGSEDIYNVNGYIFTPLNAEDGDYTISYDDNGNATLTLSSALYDISNSINNIYTPTNNLIKDNADHMTLNQTYYLITAEAREAIGKPIFQRDPDNPDKWIEILPGNSFDINKYQIQMVPYLPNTYYRIKEKGTAYTNDNGKTYISKAEYDLLPEEEQIFYSGIEVILQYQLMQENNAEDALSDDYAAQLIETGTVAKRFTDYFLMDTHEATSFYAPNRYYYNTYEDKLVTEDEKDLWELMGFPYGDWILDQSLTMTENRRFYLNVEATKQDGPYYRPGIYYYEDQDLHDFVLDYSERMRENTIYYSKNNFYILEDKTGHLSKGALWRYYKEPIPCILKIATRKSIFDMQELKGFSRTFNTIHGLILKINSLLEIDDVLTRDTNTLQGCINTIKDIINRFDTLEFNKFLATDQYGRIVTKDLNDVTITYTSNSVVKQTTLQQALIKLDNLSDRVDVLETNYNNLSTFVVDINTRLNNLASTVNALSTAISTYATNLESISTTMSTAITDLEERIEVLEGYHE